MEDYIPETQANEAPIGGQESQEINGLTVRGLEKVLTFNEAIENYTEVGHRAYQNFAFLIIVLLGILSSGCLYQGMQFLLFYPQNFECYRSLENNNLPEWLQDNSTAKWVSCSL